METEDLAQVGPNSSPAWYSIWLLPSFIDPLCTLIMKFLYRYAYGVDVYCCMNTPFSNKLPLVLFLPYSLPRCYCVGYMDSEVWRHPIKPVHQFRRVATWTWCVLSCIDMDKRLGPGLLSVVTITSLVCARSLYWRLFPEIHIACLLKRVDVDYVMMILRGQSFKVYAWSETEALVFKRHQS